MARTRTFTWTSTDDGEPRPPRPSMFPLIKPEGRNTRRDWTIGIGIIVAFAAVLAGLIALRPDEPSYELPADSPVRLVTTTTSY